jgi:hypothetical protein
VAVSVAGTGVVLVQAGPRRLRTSSAVVTEVYAEADRVAMLAAMLKHG